MSPLAGQIALGIYTVLLSVGGVIGYVKKRSQASLAAGLGSAVVALVALGATIDSGLGFYLGAVLAGTMGLMFGSRLLASRKFMPSGVLLLASAAVLVVLVLVIRDRT